MRGSAHIRVGLVAAVTALAVAGLPAPTAQAWPRARAARTCSYYSNQRAAQLRKDTRDADGDGIYCESLPCPCLKPGARSRPPRRRSHHHRRRGAVRGVERSSDCGVERWTVKTLTDSRTGSVDFEPRQATVAELRAVDPPDVGRHTARQRAEFTTYRIRARLISMKLEEDSDVHLVVADPTTAQTMIVEFPSAACVRPASATRRSQMARARAALVDACGAPSRSSFRALGGTATMTGVAFFDVIHGQRGVAPNGIELHPVLSFTGAAGCR